RSKARHRHRQDGLSRRHVLGEMGTGCQHYAHRVRGILHVAAGSDGNGVLMFHVLIKQNNESRNTTTVLADDGELIVPLAASTTYFIDASFIFDGAATPDIKYAWIYTGTITLSLLIEGY